MVASSFDVLLFAMVRVVDRFAISSNRDSAIGRFRFAKDACERSQLAFHDDSIGLFVRRFAQEKMTDQAYLDKMRLSVPGKSRFATTINRPPIGKIASLRRLWMLRIVAAATRLGDIAQRFVAASPADRIA